MYGKGILKGLGVTIKRFIDTYLDDIRWLGKRYYKPEGIAHRSSKDSRGIFTIQYPEEKLPSPEEFRFIPFLVYDEGEKGEEIIRCTSCGICAKVCPPQCIWITRTTNPETGRPVPDPAEFYIDADICMNCGLCAEYCPFDAIKMDHDYELASYSRNVLNLQDLKKPASYYEMIRPINSTAEDKARQAKVEAREAAAAKRNE
ncbi:MAG TPA: 4Fe-4S binding protein [Anaerolineales bacterium]|nr:4Fe-4S binding protein [Anaerolineales bacterium]